VTEKMFKLVNIWQSYKQERDCLVHFVRLANALLKDGESTRNNHTTGVTKTVVWTKPTKIGCRGNIA